MRYEGFVGPAYTAQSQNISAQTCYNLYPEVVESGHLKGRMVLIGTPGLQTWITLPASPVRALWAGDNRLFAVAGANLYEIDSAGTVTPRGAVGNDGKPAQIFPNGNDILIVSAGQAYIDNGGGVSAATYTPSGNVTAKTGCVLDSYFIVAEPNTKNVHISGFAAGTWDALDVAVKEGYPDNISALLADHRDLWVFGTETTEVWRNTGNADFPFERDPAGFIQRGCVAPHSATRFAGGVAWLAGETRNTQCWWARGYQPVRISTHAVEYAWRQYSTVADAIAYTYDQDGHQFLVITFPAGDATWVYDATTQLWHQRSWFNGAGQARHRGNCYASVYGKHLVGDHTSGKVYMMSPTYLTDDGTAIHRLRAAPHIVNEQKRVFYHEFQLDMEVGDGGGIDPVVYLAWSNDGGHVWGTEVTSTSGSAGEFYQRVIWRRLGQSRNRAYRVKITDPLRVVLIDAYLELTAGIS